MKHENLEIKIGKSTFLPYDKKTKNKYFIYFAFAMLLFSFVFVFSLFAIINIAKYKIYNLPIYDPIANNATLWNISYKILNLLVTPIICLITIFISISLLIFAPRISSKNSKRGSRFFYWSFWLLILSVLLNAEVQYSYVIQSEIVGSTNYHWLTPTWSRFFIVIFIFLVFVFQVFFWIMRRKFTFMPSDYEIYTQKSELKKQIKTQKQLVKDIKKKNKLLLKK